MPRRSRVTPRCAWEDEDGRRCHANGIGTPPYCRRHFELLRYEQPWEVKDSPSIDEVLDHPFVQDLVDRLRQYARTIKPPPRPSTLGPDRAYQTEWPPRPPPSNGHNGHAAPPPPPSSASIDPRIVLGFGADQAITVTDVKRRQRKLAALCHPDQGGNTEAMQRINTAADALLSQLR